MRTRIGSILDLLFCIFVWIAVVILRGVLCIFNELCG